MLFAMGGLDLLMGTIKRTECVCWVNGMFYPEAPTTAFPSIRIKL